MNHTMNESYIKSFAKFIRLFMSILLIAVFHVEHFIIGKTFFADAHRWLLHSVQIKVREL